jgi:hypothetical protein
MSETEKSLEKRASVLEVRQARERAIAVLTEHFTHDTIDVDEFESRLSRAHSADSVSDIQAVHADLPALESEPKPGVAIARATEVRPHASLLAIFGGVTRTGSWTVPREMKLTCVMGGAQLDFREAQFSPGVTEIHVSAIFGGAHIIVPPGLAVETEGSGILGGFDHVGRAPAAPDPEAPLLRVTGFACMGGVAVETRLPGEGDRAAHKRRRRERKALRREQRRLGSGRD